MDIKNPTNLANKQARDKSRAYKKNIFVEITHTRINIEQIKLNKSTILMGAILCGSRA